MEEVGRMNTKEAIKHASEVFNIPSMYQMARELSGNGLNVTTTQIRNYLNGTRMSRKVADRFHEVFDIEITDVYDRGAIRQNYSKTI